MNGSYFPYNHLNHQRISPQIRFIFLSDNYQPYREKGTSLPQLAKLTGKPYSSRDRLYYSYPHWYDPSNITVHEY